METSEKLRPVDALEKTIRDRAEKPSENSYTSKLLRGELAVLCGKVLEESAELAEAAEENDDWDRQHFIYEAGDLMYHLLVLLRRRGVDFAEVEGELARRFGVSGLEEKRSRGQSPAAAGGVTTQEQADG
ncbi:MAG: phosphoribosyl-ATP diphosphatase [Planctomycetota bacterium]